jgi:hypothetical protein
MPAIGTEFRDDASSSLNAETSAIWARFWD